MYTCCQNMGQSKAAAPWTQAVSCRACAYTLLEIKTEKLCLNLGLYLCSASFTETIERDGECTYSAEFTAADEDPTLI